MGLNSNFDKLWTQILGLERAPSLNEVILLIRVEMTQKGIMLISFAINNNTLVASDENSDKDKNKLQSQLKNLKNIQKHKQNHNHRDSMWCTYGKKSHYPLDKCWKFHDKPPY